LVKLYILNKKAFSVLEIILVLIVMSILASLMLPKFSLSKKNAQLSKVRSDIAAIRMGILLRKNKSILSKETLPKLLDNSKNFDEEGEELFGNVLTYPIVSAKKPYSWTKTNDKKYTLWLELNKDSSDEAGLTSVDFTYYNNDNYTNNNKKYTFSCEVTNVNCLRVTQ